MMVVNRYELFPNVYANDEQVKAIDKLLLFLDRSNKDIYFLLKGRGGTGKTTLIKKITEDYDGCVIGAALSNAAKEVLLVSMGGEVHTIAKLLGLRESFNLQTGELEFKPRTQWQRENLPPPPISRADLIIIDEASMISKSIFDAIKENKKEDTKVIFMGDNVQLPPIDKDRRKDEDSVIFLIEDRKPECFAELKKRMRQGEESPILPITDLYAYNIENYNKNKPVLENPLFKEFRINKSNDKGSVEFTNDFDNVIKKIAKDFVDNPEDIKHSVAIAHRNKCKEYNNIIYGKHSVEKLNESIRNEILKIKNIDIKDLDYKYNNGDMIIFNTPYLKNARMIATNNQKGIVCSVREDTIKTPYVNTAYKIYRIGIDLTVVNREGVSETVPVKIEVISPESEKEYKEDLKRLWDNNKKKVWYSLSTYFANIDFAYAITVHKVQGSTYNNAYVFESDIMSIKKSSVKERNQAMYVACSRPREKLVIVN